MKSKTRIRRHLRPLTHLCHRLVRTKQIEKKKKGLVKTLNIIPAFFLLTEALEEREKKRKKVETGATCTQDF